MGVFHHVQNKVDCILKVYSKGKDTSIEMSHAVSWCTRKVVLKISLHAKLVYYVVFVTIIIVTIIIIKFMQFSSNGCWVEAGCVRPNPNTDIQSSACSNCCLVSCACHVYIVPVKTKLSNYVPPYPPCHPCTQMLQYTGNWLWLNWELAPQR